MPVESGNFDPELTQQFAFNITVRKIVIKLQKNH